VARDGVRMLVATGDGIAHARFSDLPRFLAAGDLLVVNTSATLPAAVTGHRASGASIAVHLSTVLDDGRWVLELRQQPPAAGRVTDAVAGEQIALPGTASIRLVASYPGPASTRMWTADPVGTGDAGAYLAAHGRPIRYSYVPQEWPLAAYQTVFARVPGSAEMASAARPFTAELVTALVSAGVRFGPVTLHAGVGSLEEGELPLPEQFAVPETTAELVNLTRSAGRRVIAVGTTSTRALESAAAADGTVRAATGWTGLVLGAERPARVVTGLITGWHEQGASHLRLLQAVAGLRLVAAAYQQAEASGYLWHEFGDSCLLLPQSGRAGHRAEPGRSQRDRLRQRP
jgi:S-adenosylmethionine:tRNA ribosyltransferase-isomerase